MYTAKDENVKNLKSTAQNLADNANDVIQQGKRDLREVANDAGRKVRSALHNATDEISQVSENVTTQIRSKPVQSSLIALGVGVVLGALFRRR